MPRQFLKDDITQKVVLQRRANSYKLFRERIQMRKTNGFYLIKASNFVKDGGIIKSERYGFHSTGKRNSRIFQTN